MQYPSNAGVGRTRIVSAHQDVSLSSLKRILRSCLLVQKTMCATDRNWMQKHSTTYCNSNSAKQTAAHLTEGNTQAVQSLVALWRGIWQLAFCSEHCTCFRLYGTYHWCLLDCDSQIFGLAPLCVTAPLECSGGIMLTPSSLSPISRAVLLPLLLPSLTPEPPGCKRCTSGKHIVNTWP